MGDEIRCILDAVGPHCMSTSKDKNSVQPVNDDEIRDLILSIQPDQEEGSAEYIDEAHFLNFANDMLGKDQKEELNMTFKIVSNMRKEEKLEDLKRSGKAEEYYEYIDKEDVIRLFKDLGVDLGEGGGGAAAAGRQERPEQRSRGAHQHQVGHGGVRAAPERALHRHARVGSVNC